MGGGEEGRRGVQGGDGRREEGGDGEGEGGREGEGEEGGGGGGGVWDNQLWEALLASICLEIDHMGAFFEIHIKYRCQK